jgi:hypothetical protein
MIGKLIFLSGINPSPYPNFLHTFIIPAGLNPMEVNKPQASFVSTGSIPIGMDKYNKKIIIVTIRDPDLFRVEN